MTAAKAILSAENLSRRVTGDGRQKTIIDQFTYGFRECESYVVLGSSGAGKSSLLRLLNRLDEPTDGRVLFEGEDICRMAPPALRRKVGYLFQTPYLFSGTVRDNIRYAKAEMSDHDVFHLADQCRIARELIDQDVTHLSLGEQQRVALARLLATDPAVALLDEPTSALDPANTEAIEGLIKNVVNTCRLTVVIVTHNPQQALRIGGEALLMVDGRLVETGPVKNVVQNPQTDLGRKYLNRELS